RKTDVAQVANPTPPPPSKPATPETAESLPGGRPRAGWLRIGLVSALLLLVAVVTFRLAGRFNWLVSPLSNTDGVSAAANIRPIHSIAVLPLQNLSNDPSQEYFADGMGDELITDLAQLGSLRVISRTSTVQYKGTK